MSLAAPTARQDGPATPAAVVDEFLRRIMMPDPGETATVNGARDQWVKKRIERTETVAGGSPSHTGVYSLGTLYGAWPDGSLFAGKRCVDRDEVCHGSIARMDVQNDRAAGLLVRASLALL